MLMQEKNSLHVCSCIQQGGEAVDFLALSSGERTLYIEELMKSASAAMSGFYKSHPQEAQTLFGFDKEE